MPYPSSKQILINHLVSLIEALSISIVSPSDSVLIRIAQVRVGGDFFVGRVLSLICGVSHPSLECYTKPIQRHICIIPAEQRWDDN